MTAWTSLAGQRDACANEAEPAEPRRASGAVRLAGLQLAGALGMGEGRAQHAMTTTNLLTGMELTPYSDGLTATGDFEADRKAAQRLYYKPSSRSYGYPVDLIPFGGVESPPDTIAWPAET